MHKRVFSPQRYLQSRNEIITPPKKRKGRREWVISRGLCHYRFFSLTDIPNARQDSVLQLKLKQWSPFQEYASYQVWQGGHVQVWIWDQQKLQNEFTHIGLKRAIILPETLLHARPSTEGIQLLRCLEGVEGQIWKQGLLIGSRWWADMPTEKEWVNFQRIYGLPIQSNLPIAIEDTLLERPWGKTKTRLSRLNLYQEQIWVILGVTIFASLLTWQAVSIWKWQDATKQVQTQIEKFDKSITPILTARNQALTAKQISEQLLALNPYPSQLELMAKIAEILPRKETKLLEWFYQKGQLRFIIETRQRDPTFYIKKFQAQPIFKEIKAKTGRNSNQLSISMQVKPKL